MIYRVKVMSWNLEGLVFRFFVEILLKINFCPKIFQCFSDFDFGLFVFGSFSGREGSLRIKVRSHLISGG